jgi:HsdM N-terminal domain
VEGLIPPQTEVHFMFEQAFKNIDDVLRKEAGCTTELDYTEQTSWLLFLKYLDGLEQDRADEAALKAKSTPSSSISLTAGRNGPRPRPAPSST